MYQTSLRELTTLGIKNAENLIAFLRLAVVAMAGLAAEGLKYDKLVGQSADLFTLQVCN